MDDTTECGALGPLKGLKVIEMGSFIAGPFCGQILADLGADVIKIEAPDDGDAMRKWGLLDTEGCSYWWRVIARNKRSMALDLRRPEGAKIARDLVLDADVMIENFRPGTIEGWGMAPEELLAENPGLIIGRVSGFGQTGPYSSRTGFGAIAEAMAGMRTLAGFPDMPPVRAGLSIGDSAAGLFTCIGILSALIRRGETGQGQVVDVGITDAVLGLSESILAEYGGMGAIRSRAGTVLPRIAPSNIYPTADDCWILIAGNGDAIFRRLCQAMQRTDLLDDPHYSSHVARGTHQHDLDGIVAAWTKTQTLPSLLSMLEQYGVPAGPISDAADVAANPHFRARESVIEIDKGEDRTLMQGIVPRLSGESGHVRWTGPDLGAHTGQVLLDRLGFAPARIAALHESGVIFDAAARGIGNL